MVQIIKRVMLSLSDSFEIFGLGSTIRIKHFPQVPLPAQRAPIGMLRAINDSYTVEPSETLILFEIGSKMSVNLLFSIFKHLDELH